MEISTVLKITLEEIKQLLADKHGIQHYFELQILDFDGTVLSSGADKVCQVEQTKQTKEAPWYPDDSGEWIEIPDSCMGIPEELWGEYEIHYLLKGERDKKILTNYKEYVDVLDFSEQPNLSSRIVAYKKVK